MRLTFLRPKTTYLLDAATLQSKQHVCPSMVDVGKVSDKRRWFRNLEDDVRRSWPNSSTQPSLQRSAAEKQRTLLRHSDACEFMSLPQKEIAVDVEHVEQACWASDSHIWWSRCLRVLSLLDDCVVDTLEKQKLCDKMSTCMNI